MHRSQNSSKEMGHGKMIFSGEEGTDAGCHIEGLEFKAMLHPHLETLQPKKSLKAGAAC
jgi:hypothetical protein